MDSNNLRSSSSSTKCKVANNSNLCRWLTMVAVEEVEEHPKVDEVVATDHRTPTLWECLPRR